MKNKHRGHNPHHNPTKEPRAGICPSGAVPDANEKTVTTERTHCSCNAKVENSKKWFRNPEFYTAMFTGFLFVVGLATAIVLGMQASIMRGTLEDTHRLMQITNDQLRASIRPRVGVVGLKTGQLNFDDKGDASMFFWLTVQNFSNNTAEGVWGGATLQVTEDINLIDKTFNDCGSHPDAMKTFGKILFSGANPVFFGSTGFFPKKLMVSQQENGAEEIWLNVCIPFRDEAGNSYATAELFWLVDQKTLRPILVVPTPNTVVSLKGHWEEYNGHTQWYAPLQSSPK